MNKRSVMAILVVFAACSTPVKTELVIPAEEFSKAMHEGTINNFSLSRMGEGIKDKREPVKPEGTYGDKAAAAPDSRAQLRGDPRFLDQGFVLKKSFEVPSPEAKNDESAALARTAMFPGQHSYPPAPMPPAPPPGSSAPYYLRQMTTNPSLWPDQAQGGYLFSDLRAFQPMDVITVIIDEDTRGKKKAETDAETKYDLLAAIENFFGVETKDWASNNAGLDPTALIKARTDSKFEGKAEAERTGSLSAEMSAVIMEVFPNGLMRVEGTKIVSMDSEEEIMVITGLVRTRDINAKNQVESSRIANLRIDFYGKGLLAEQQRPGWGVRVFQWIWPF